jgi:hypothetical protein
MNLKAREIIRSHWAPLSFRVIHMLICMLVCKQIIKWVRKCRRVVYITSSCTVTCGAGSRTNVSRFSITSLTICSSSSLPYNTNTNVLCFKVQVKVRPGQCGNENYTWWITKNLPPTGCGLFSRII